MSKLTKEQRVARARVALAAYEAPQRTKGAAVVALLTDLHYFSAATQGSDGATEYMEDLLDVAAGRFIDECDDES